MVFPTRLGRSVSVRSIAIAAEIEDISATTPAHGLYLISDFKEDWGEYIYIMIMPKPFPNQQDCHPSTTSPSRSLTYRTSPVQASAAPSTYCWPPNRVFPPTDPYVGLVRLQHASWELVQVIETQALGGGCPDEEIHYSSHTQALRKYMAPVFISLP